MESCAVAVTVAGVDLLWRDAFCYHSTYCGEQQPRRKKSAFSRVSSKKKARLDPHYLPLPSWEVKGKTIQLVAFYGVRLRVCWLCSSHSARFTVQDLTLRLRIGRQYLPFINDYSVGLYKQKRSPALVRRLRSASGQISFQIEDHNFLPSLFSTCLRSHSGPKESNISKACMPWIAMPSPQPIAGHQAQM
jgi:hypothetical protein